MSRKTHDLGIDNLEDLPDPCRRCVFWEVAGTRGGQEGGAGAKEAWWQATQLEWGTPGKALYVDGRMVAYALFAPPGHLAGRPAPAPVSDDALFLATVWVAEDAGSGGAGKTLVQAVLRETIRQGARGVEAFGVRGRGREPCVVPVGFLEAMGFRVLREHPLTPLLRLDVRQTARLRETVDSALESVVSVLSRRERAPARPVRS